MTGYYRQCIPNYATLAQPLTELTRKRHRFDWSDKCQTAFDALKKALVSDSMADLWGKADVEDSGYILTKGILYSIWTPTTTSPEYPRLVLPPQFQKAVIDKAHKEVGHLATHKTLARLREAYVWPHMRESVRTRLNKCATCAVHRKRQDHVAMGDMPLRASPMQVVAVDLIGPFVASAYNNKYIFTVIDHCNRLG